MTSFAASDNVIPGRGGRPSFAGGPSGDGCAASSCADRLLHAATVTSYVRMRSSSVGLALVACARDLGRRLSAAQSWRTNVRGRVQPGSERPGQRVRRTMAVPTCYITPPADGIYSLTALFVFRFGHSADDRSFLSSGHMPVGHEQLVLRPFRRWLCLSFLSALVC